MNKLTIRLVGLTAIGLLGLGLGLLMRTHAPQDVSRAYAAYPEYSSLAGLVQASDAVIYGVVKGSGEPFMDYGAQGTEEVPTLGDAVAMRLFTVVVRGPEGSDLSIDQSIQIAVTDVEESGISGDAYLADGDHVYLFLEELDNSVFKVANVNSDNFFVVVGGRQGVFRDLGNDQWRQDDSPHRVAESEEVSTADVSRAIVVTGKELEDAARKG